MKVTAGLVLLLSLFQVQAQAEIFRYSYTGNILDTEENLPPETLCAPVGTCFIRGSFTLSNALAPNLALSFISPDAWQFTVQESGTPFFPSLD